MRHRGSLELIAAVFVLGSMAGPPAVATQVVDASSILVQAQDEGVDPDRPLPPEQDRGTRAPWVGWALAAVGTVLVLALVAAGWFWITRARRPGEPGELRDPEAGSSR